MRPEFEPLLPLDSDPSVAVFVEVYLVPTVVEFSDLALAEEADECGVAVREVEGDGGGFVVEVVGHGDGRVRFVEAVGEDAGCVGVEDGEFAPADLGGLVSGSDEVFEVVEE